MKKVLLLLIFSVCSTLGLTAQIYENTFRGSAGNDLDQAVTDGFTNNGTEQRTSAGGYLLIGSGDCISTFDIDFSMYSEIVVSFKTATFGGSGANLGVSVIDDNGTTLVETVTPTSSSAYPTSTVTIDPADYTSGGKIEFCRGGSNNSIRFRDLTITGTVALPVELTSFAAKNTNNHVALSWTTASELNNDYFSVETSTDGRTFTAIDEVIGAGTTQVAQSYSFTHKTPANGVNYYRLKQVDFDGAFEYSNIVSARVEKEGTVIINPSAAVSQIQVEVLTDIAENATIGIYDMMGRTVLMTNFDGALTQKVIDIAGLNKGHYIVRVQAGNETMTKRFVKITE